MCLESFSKVPLLLLFLLLLLSLFKEKTIEGLGRTAAALAITTLATSSVVVDVVVVESVDVPSLEAIFVDLPD